MNPVRLTVQNFYSHTFSEVDFSSFNSCLIVGNTEGDYSKSNGSGKSVIFESILWALFNKSRSAMMDDIILWGENTCSVEFIFTHFENSYKVLRGRNRASSTSSVDIFMMEDEKWSNISGSTSGTTNKIIESTIGLDYKTFTNSVYFRQNDVSEFADSEPGRRKEILKSVIDVSRWDSYEKKARDLLRSLKRESDSLSESVALLGDEKAKNKDLRDSFSFKSNELLRIETERKTANTLILSLRENYSKIKESLDTDSYDKVTEEIASLKEAGSSKKEALDDLKASILKYTDIKRSTHDKISNLNEKISGISHVDNISKSISDIRELILSSRANIDAKRSVKKYLESSMVADGSCSVCEQPISTDLEDRLTRDLARKVGACALTIESSSLEADRLSSLLDLRMNDKRNNELFRDTSMKVDTLRLEETMVSEKVLSLGKRKDTLVDGMLKIKSDIECKSIMLNSLKNDDFQKLSARMLSVKESRVALNDSISSLSKEVGALTEKIKMSDKLLGEIGASLERSKKVVSEIVILEKLVKMLGKSGIQTILLDTIIEDLEATSNRLLNHICNEPSLISLETQRVGSDGTSIVETLDIKINIDGVSHGFKSLSGGEKFRIALSLRIALSEVSSRHGNSSLEFLLLDEINSPLDRHGTNTLFINVIKALEDKYKILVITHDESLKEKFDNVIDVTKVNGRSSIELHCE
jgi:DNA repair exonuclease SbcCD ATPase subunit